jgi:flagellar assembly protein FliH
MALIRNSNAASIARDAIVLDLGDLREQGERLVRSARAEAERIVAEARAERLRIIQGADEQGRAEGYGKGLEEGRAEGREQAAEAALVEHRERLSKLEQSWTAALGEFASRREDLVQGALRDVVRLAVTIAERVTKRTIELNPALVESQLAAVLAVVVRPTELVVRINPDDRAVLTAALPVLMASMPAIRHVELVDDPGVERGGCVASTRADASSGDAGGGEIDARISTQLSRLVETLMPGDDAQNQDGAPA